MEALPSGLHPALRRRANEAAGWIRAQKDAGRTVTVVHHIDADGLSAGAIASTALERAGIPYMMQPVKSLDDHHISLVQELEPEALWFGDLGSAAQHQFAPTPRLVCDHHTVPAEPALPEVQVGLSHLNPVLDGLAEDEISGSGLAYLAAAALNDANLDLLPLALVGASGDQNDRRIGFHGTDALLLEHGQRSGLLLVEEDVRWFGIETRPLRKFLNLAQDPDVPGISKDRAAAEATLARLQIPLEAAGRERTWADLEEDERRRLRSALVEHLLDCGLVAEAARLTKPIVRITRERRGTPTRELREFATLLNSTARYDRAEIGLAVARGDRGAAYEEALDLLLDHRKHLVGSLEVFSRTPRNELNAIHWLDVRDQVRDTVVGIVCGMALEGLGLRRDRILVAFAWTPDGRTKVSARAPHEMATRGCDLATALRTAAEQLGGNGGGHPGAAGATIPRGNEAVFAAHVDVIVCTQVGVRAVEQTKFF